LTIPSEVMLHVELVWICKARWFWVWLVETVWAAFLNVPWAQTWLNVFSASSQEIRRISF